MLALTEQRRLRRMERENEIGLGEAVVALDEAAAASAINRSPGFQVTLPHRLPSPAAAWWTVAVLTFLYALSLMDRQILSLMVDHIRRDLGVSDFAIGLLNGLAFAFFYVIFGLAFGVASDRYSRRGII